MPRVLNKKYWPFQTEIEFKNDDHYLDIIEWCNENLESRWTRYNNWGKKDIFCFKDEQEHLVFLLRWI